MAGAGPSTTERRAALLRDRLDAAHASTAPGASAAGCVLDCLGREVALARGGGAEADAIDAVAAAALEERFGRLAKDAAAGYDALHADLDAHLGGAAVGRRVALSPAPFPKARAALRAATAPRDVAAMLRRRLNRPARAADADAGREAPPACTGAEGKPDEPVGDPRAQRFMLHILAENLEYLVTAVDGGSGDGDAA